MARPNLGRIGAGALSSAAVAAAVSRLPGPPIAGWQRINYRGRSVSLAGGAAAAAGVLTGALFAGPLRRASLIVAGSAALAGVYDDLLAPKAEQRTDKGLTGHLEALRSGRVSGGIVKVAVIGAASVIAAGQLPKPGRARWSDRVIDATLIAGSANLLNLFDLRPGRAGKVALGTAAGVLVSGGWSVPAAAAAGASLATLPADLGERTMLGDLGANALGASIGLSLAATAGRGRLAAVAIVTGLTIASERVSFSKVIAAVPSLRWLDELGRSSRPDVAVAAHQSP
jgi:UDP-N-acetylmuramyl pentapeptide phosphotransferase/UDP-N-acetylglucosamine-1-phosphate transferase